jgi:hypothetical protein
MAANNSNPRNRRNRQSARNRNSSFNKTALLRLTAGNNITLYDAESMEKKASITKAPPHFTEVVQCRYNLTSSAGGDIAVALNTDPVAGTTAIINWATRYQSLFREYRVLVLRVKAESLSPTAGKTLLSMDDQSNIVPDVNSITDKRYVTFSNAVGSYDAHAGAKWLLGDLGEASWISTANSRTPCYVLLFTNTANWLTPAAATTNIGLTLTYTIEFRGRV